MGYQPAADGRESHKADPSHGGPEGIDRGGIGAALFPVEAFPLLCLPLMFLDQSGTGRKDGRESEKQAADARPPFQGDYAGDNRYDSAGDEAQYIFVPLRLFQS